MDGFSKSEPPVSTACCSAPIDGPVIYILGLYHPIRKFWDNGSMGINLYTFVCSLPDPILSYVGITIKLGGNLNNDWQFM